MAGEGKMRQSCDSARARSSRLRSKSGALIERSHDLIAKSAFLAVSADQNVRRQHPGGRVEEFLIADGALKSCAAATGLGAGDLWMRFAGLGGEASRFEIEAFFEGGMALHSAQYDILVLAVNERLDELGEPRFERRAS